MRGAPYLPTVTVLTKSSSPASLKMVCSGCDWSPRTRTTSWKVVGFARDSMVAWRASLLETMGPPVSGTASLRYLLAKEEDNVVVGWGSNLT